MFECAANGNESLKIRWTRNNVHVTSSRFRISNEISNSERRSVLTVKRSTIRDSGLYQCAATNADNEMILSKPAELLSKTMSTNKLYHDFPLFSSTINNYTS